MTRSMLPIGAIYLASMLVACSRGEPEVDVQAEETAIREVLNQIVSAFNTSIGSPTP